MRPGGVLAQRLRQEPPACPTAYLLRPGLSQDPILASVWTVAEHEPAVTSSRLCCLCPCISLSSWIMDGTYALGSSICVDGPGVAGLTKRLAVIVFPFVISDGCVSTTVLFSDFASAAFYPWPACKCQLRRYSKQMPSSDARNTRLRAVEHRQGHHYLMSNDRNESAQEGNTIRHWIFLTEHNCQ